MIHNAGSGATVFCLTKTGRSL